MINKHKLGLVFGAFLGLWHFLWAWLVLAGLAQSFLNWIFRLHFIQPPYTILPFSLGLAVALIVITSITGYAIGWTMGTIWNWLRADGSTDKSIPAMRKRQHAIGRL